MIGVVTLWGILELAASFPATHVSPDGLDCGISQLRGLARAGHSCAELQADPVLCIRLWFRWLNVARSMCPSSTASALGAVASGKCGGAPKLIARRCARAGVSC